MNNNRNSIMSKGWLIIGIVLLLTGSYLVFITNSLYYESNQLARNYPIDKAENQIIDEVINRISLDAFFLTITSIIIITVGTIMCLEWFLFSKFLKQYNKD